MVLVCLPADEPQGSHGTFRRQGGEKEGGRKEEGMDRGESGEEEGEIKECRGSQETREKARETARRHQGD